MHLPRLQALQSGDQERCGTLLDSAGVAVVRLSLFSLAKHAAPQAVLHACWPQASGHLGGMRCPTLYWQ